MVNVDELGQKAVELNKNFDESFIELGRTLRVIQQIGGVEDFRRICEAAGIGTRKAYYLASISEKIEGLHIPTKRLKAVGWTKLMTISPYLTKETWKDLLSAAENNTNRDLQVIVKGEDAGEQPALRPALFQRGRLQGLREVGDQPRRRPFGAWTAPQGEGDHGAGQEGSRRAPPKPAEEAVSGEEEAARLKG